MTFNHEIWIWHFCVVGQVCKANRIWNRSGKLDIYDWVRNWKTCPAACVCVCACACVCACVANAWRRWQTTYTSFPPALPFRGAFSITRLGSLWMWVSSCQALLSYFCPCTIWKHWKRAPLRCSNNSHVSFLYFNKSRKSLHGFGKTSFSLLWK